MRQRFQHSPQPGTTGLIAGCTKKKSVVRSVPRFWGHLRSSARLHPIRVPHERNGDGWSGDLAWLSQGRTHGLASAWESHCFPSVYLSWLLLDYTRLWSFCKSSRSPNTSQVDDPSHHAERWTIAVNCVILAPRAVLRRPSVGQPWAIHTPRITHRAASSLTIEVRSTQQGVFSPCSPVCATAAWGPRWRFFVA